MSREMRISQRVRYITSIVRTNLSGTLDATQVPFWAECPARYLRMQKGQISVNPRPPIAAR
jgi:hypothetical protein